MLTLVEFFIGKKDQNGNDVPVYTQDETIAIIAACLTAQFGGCTVEDGHGYWQNTDTKELIYEGSARIYAYADLDAKQLETYRPEWKQAAGRAAKVANQQTVLLVESRMLGEINYVVQS